MFLKFLEKIGRKKVAVKIRRNDSPGKNLKREAELLKIKTSMRLDQN